MIWRKPADMRYTQMCIYIDENVPKLAEPGKYPEVEEKIYNYLWLLVKALAIKKSMFQDFADYDPYAFYAANRLYFALRKNYLNRGQIVKGKEIRPIKSCLNYTKALLYPMKIEFQRESYREIIDEEFASKQFDALALQNQQKEKAETEQPGHTIFPIFVRSVLQNAGGILDGVLERLPFNKNSAEYRKIRISILLNCNQNLKIKNKLDADLTTIMLWHLPKSMAGYVRVLLKEFYTELSKELIDCYQSTKFDDVTMEKIVTYREGPDYEYED